MKLKPEHQSQKDLEAARGSAALRKLANFCTSYKPEDIDDLNSGLLTVVTGESYSSQPAKTKEQILDYCEAMEEVLPALHIIHDYLTSLGDPAKPITYKEQVAYVRFFAALTETHFS